MNEQEVFEQIGEEGFRLLVREFYAQVPDDEILGPMYPQEDMVGAEERLASFLIYRFGGPQTYIQERGHPRLRMRHMPFQINQDARDRWMQMMSNAIERAKLPEPSSSMLNAFFEQMATFLINKPQ